MYDIYIAGKMGGRKVKDVLRERHIVKQLCRNLGLSFYDPAADEGLEKMDPEDTISLSLSHSTMRRFVNKDDENVDKSRILLNITGDMFSDGTSWEMGRMHYRNQRSIVMVGQKRFTGELMGFSNIKALSIHPSIVLALEYIKAAKEQDYALYTSSKPGEVSRYQYPG